MIPSCIKLKDVQITKLNHFRDFVISKVGLKEYEDAYLEEQCVPSSNISFELYETGICTVIYAKAFGYKCDLTIDDDGELSGEDFKKDE